MRSCDSECSKIGPSAAHKHQTHMLATLLSAAKDTGLSPESVLAEARSIGAVAVDPTGGPAQIVWSVFDRFWRSPANRQAAKQRDRNRRATQSATKIQQSAKEQSQDEILRDARETEDARCAAALERACAQQRAASCAKFGRQ